MSLQAVFSINCNLETEIEGKRLKLINENEFFLIFFGPPEDQEAKNFEKLFSGLLDWSFCTVLI